MLKRGDHDRETSELVALIDDAGRGLLTIVNDLLDVSKVEAGKLEISPQPTDLAALVARTLDGDLNAYADDVESSRLLYVAATRAEQHLHLLACLGCDRDGELKNPAADTLLSRV